MSVERLLGWLNGFYVAKKIRKRPVYSSVTDHYERAQEAQPAASQARLDGAAQLRHHRSMETRCAQCGAAMTCKQEGGCWCAELPHVPMPADEEGCLCRNCLLAKIEALQNPVKRKEA
jgi:hypothetical protein